MKQKKALALLGLAAAVLAAGVLAYYSADHQAANPFDTGQYGTTTVETFNPKDGENWKPGEEVNKDVSVKNTGTNPIVVRAKFSEAWTRGAKSPQTTFAAVDAETDGIEKITTVRQGDGSEAAKTDGQTEGDWTVVHKNGIAADWIPHSDGWYYYKTTLEAEGETAKFLDSVTLDKDTDMGVTGKTYLMTYTKGGVTVTDVDLAASEYAFCIDTESEKVDLKRLGEALGLKEEDDLTIRYVSETGSLKGYSSADYTLTITTEVTQASETAVKAAFGKEVKDLPDSLEWSLVEDAS